MNSTTLAQLDMLRNEFKAFMEKIFVMPGLPIPKQQAIFRFEEGHMWMQQAIIHNVAPAAPAAKDDVQEPLPETETKPVEAVA